jgi:putative transposase
MTMKHNIGGTGSEAETLGGARPPKNVALANRLELVFAQLGTPDVGRVLVRKAIDEAPVRDVSGKRGNVLSRFPSKKTDCQLLLESRNGELPQAYMLEEDDDVLWYCAQAHCTDLILRDANGKVVGRTTYTPDFLVVRRHRLQIVEMRDEAQLIADSLRSDQYYRDADGRWHYRAAEEHYRSIGFEYLLISNLQIPAVLIGNMRFLEDYLRPECPELEDDVRKRLVEVVQRLRCAPLYALINEHEFRADQIFRAIVTRWIHVDLAVDRLDVGSDLVIYSDEATCAAHRVARQAEVEPVLPVPGTAHIASGTEIEFSGSKYRVVFCTEREVSVIDSNGHMRAIPLAAVKQLHELATMKSDGTVVAAPASATLATISPCSLRRAIKRLDALRGNDQNQFGERSLSRFANDVRHARNDLEALLMLTDSAEDRGNRTARFSPIVEELADRAIRERYNQPEKCSKTAAYATYLALCDKAAEEGEIVLPMSYSTFCKRCDSARDVRKRQGKRAAYQQRAIPQVLNQAFPVHGVRPHEICHIDHTVATIATVSPEGVDLGKPTLTLAVDGNTTHPRAFLVSYDPPSAALVLMVLRDYVRRHNRLPRVIVVDNGKEFHSKELELFCRIYSIEIRYRPPGMPRGGAMVERGLGAIEEEVFGQMEGNTRQMRDPRLVTKSINPFKRAVWTLTAVWGAIEEYLFKVRPARVHPTLGMTPDQFEEKRVAETGSRDHTLIRFDENIMLMTCPHARRPFHKVDRRRGIWVDGTYYWHQDLSRVRAGCKVEVRVEPWIANIVYVLLDKKWIVAVARNLRPYAGRTRRSVEVALREEKRRARLLADSGLRSKSNLKGKERLWAPETFDSRIEAQQKEMLYLFGRLGMVEALPSAIDEELRVHQSAINPPLDGVARKVASEDEQQIDDVVAVDVAQLAYVGARCDLLEGIDGLL